jgi:hypothetical protein
MAVMRFWSNQCAVRKSVWHQVQYVIVVCAMMCCLSQSSMAQNTQPDEEEEEEMVHPYPKTVGVGLVFGANTIVEVLADRGDAAFDGIFAWGFAGIWYFTNHLAIEASFVRAVNNAVTVASSSRPNPQAQANTHRTIDISLQYTPNPYNRVNFFCGAGVSFIQNNYYPFNGSAINQDNVGINGALGLRANIETPFGFIVPTAEWRVSGIFQSSMVTENVLFGNSTNPTGLIQKSGQFFSIPRLTISFCPKL